jgi:hypothetical protein
LLSYRPLPWQQRSLLLGFRRSDLLFVLRLGSSDPPLLLRLLLWPSLVLCQQQRSAASASLL